MRGDIEVELLVGEVHRAVDVDQRVLGVEDEQPAGHQALLQAEVGGRAVDLHLVVAEQLGHQVVSDIEAGDFGQAFADRTVVDQHLQFAIGATEDLRHRIAAAAETGVAVQLAEAGLHRREAGEQLFQLEAPRAHLHSALHRLLAAIQADVRLQLAAGHAEAQGLQAQQAVVEHQMGIEVADRQLVAVDDTLAGEFHVGVHVAPALGTEFLHRQHLVARLAAGLPALLFFGIAVGADQRAEVGEAQLLGGQLAGQLRPRLASDEGQAAVQVAGADLAVEVLVAEQCAALLLEPRQQVSVGGVGRSVRQGDAGQRIEIGHAGPGQLQAQVEGAEVERVGQGADHRGTGAAGTDLGL